MTVAALIRPADPSAMVTFVNHPMLWFRVFGCTVVKHKVKPVLRLLKNRGFEREIRTKPNQTQVNGSINPSSIHQSTQRIIHGVYCGCCVNACCSTPFNVKHEKSRCLPFSCFFPIIHVLKDVV